MMTNVIMMIIGHIRPPTQSRYVMIMVKIIIFVTNWPSWSSSWSSLVISVLRPNPAIFRPTASPRRALREKGQGDDDDDDDDIDNGDYDNVKPALV